MAHRIFTLLLVALSLGMTLGDDCCYRLQEALPGVTSYPSSFEYAVLNDERWSNTSILSPSCIVTPGSTNDVSTAVKILTTPGLTSCSFAVKAGGHNPNPGFNDISDGVTIDLSFLNETSLSPDGTNILLGAGGHWQNAYSNMPTLSFPGGICGGTGIGGVTLGGGMSLFLADVGWVFNSVLNYELVLANGQIINANAHENKDLFRALKGGASNFGILTHIELELAQGDGQLYGGLVLSPAYPNVTAQVLSDLAAFTTANNQDTKAAIQVAFLYSAAGSVVNNLVAHTDSIAGAPILQPFVDMPQINNTLGMINLAEAAEEATSVQPSGFRYLSATISFENNAATLAAVHEASLAIYATIADIPYLEFIISYIPLPYVVVEQSLKRGGDVLGLDSQKRDRISLFFAPQWRDAQYDARMNAAAQAWYNAVAQVTQSLGTSDSFLYLNFAGSFQNPFAGYGSSNEGFIKHVAQKYDPTGVFQRQMPGGFKLQ